MQPKILIIDDDEKLTRLLERFLGDFGFSVSSAHRPSQGLKLIKKTPFDLVILDIMLPEMDGFEVCKVIRKTSTIPIIMLTAKGEEEDVVTGFETGADDYITKPFEVPELRARLGLVEGLVQARQSRTRKIFATQNISAPSQPDAPDNAIELHEPISIYDVDNVIEYMAMQNYVAQLSRGALFGSTTFAFTIRKIEEHHQSMSPFEFYSLVSDVPEVISDTLAGHQFLMSYAGSGTFVCVTESGWRPKMSALMAAVNLALSRTELYDNSARKLYVRVSAGEAIRLIWKSAGSVMEAVAAAHTSAEAASEAHERSLTDFWSVEQRA